MFTNFKLRRPTLSNIFAVVALIFLAMNISRFVLSDWYTNHTATVISMTQPAEIMNPQFQVVKSIKAGSGIILNMHTYVNAVGCYSVYNHWLDGPVTYQFPVTRTAHVFLKQEYRNGHPFFMLPADLPAGHYKWMLTAFPTCKGYELSPLMIFTGAEFDVTP
jgi:hypothetical protein